MSNIIWVLCNKLLFEHQQKMLVSWQFSGTYGVTKYGSAWSLCVWLYCATEGVKMQRNVCFLGQNSMWRLQACLNWHASRCFFFLLPLPPAPHSPLQFWMSYCPHFVPSSCAEGTLHHICPCVWLCSGPHFVPSSCAEEGTSHHTCPCVWRLTACSVLFQFTLQPAFIIVVKCVLVWRVQRWSWGKTTEGWRWWKTCCDSWLQLTTYLRPFLCWAQSLPMHPLVSFAFQFGPCLYSSVVSLLTSLVWLFFPMGLSAQFCRKNSWRSWNSQCSCWRGTFFFFLLEIFNKSWDLEYYMWSAR